MKVDTVLPVTKVLGALGRGILYYPMIGRALGSMDAAIFLGNFMYWDGKQADKVQGFIFKNAIHIEKETGLKRSRQENAREVLKNFGILQEKKQGTPAILYFRFIWDQLDKILSNQIISENPDVDINDYLGEIAGDKSKKKTPKSPKELKEDKTPPILYQMKEAFDHAYEAIPGYEQGYAWSKDKKGGKDWAGLKALKNHFVERGIQRKKKELQASGQKIKEGEVIAYSDEEILISWTLFLGALPKYHTERNFTPSLLLQNFNPIITEIINVNKARHKPENAGAKPNARSVASDYV